MLVFIPFLLKIRLLITLVTSNKHGTLDYHIHLPPAMLQEVIDKAEGAEAVKEKNELEELKQLLPEITEKIEDAKESQRTAAAASEAIHQTLVSWLI